MRLLESLEREHELIEQLAGSLFRWAEEDGKREDAVSFARFLDVYSGGFHHGREDGLLIPALIEALEIPADSNPIKVIQEEHALVGELAERIGRGDRDAARQVARILWEHIDKENSVLFLEAADRLPRAGVFELEDRPMTPAESEVEALGRELIRTYPPLEDPSVIRGDGCIACSAFTVRCRGIEAEWWNRWEWEEHFRRDGEG
ncbi:MAG: hemerythrin domain-containing protein [Acidobacteria bacterium]|nr:hemerythrin domain-containing protein [Acidobacteriota bacterium]